MTTSTNQPESAKAIRLWVSLIVIALLLSQLIGALIVCGPLRPLAHGPLERLQRDMEPQPQLQAVGGGARALLTPSANLRIGGISVDPTSLFEAPSDEDVQQMREMFQRLKAEDARRPEASPATH